MKYKYHSALAGFFRGSRNAWATKAEIVKALDGTDSARRMFTQYRTGGRFEKRYDRATQLMQYRFHPDELYQTVESTERSDQDKVAAKMSNARVQGRVESISSKFCKRYGVAEPHQATQRDPQALAVWCEMVGRS